MNSIPTALRLNLRIASIAKYLFLAVVLVFAVFPIIYILLSSLKTNQEILTSGARFWPERIVWRNYLEAWHLANFKRYTFNSIFLSFFVVTGTILTSTTAGYVFARGNFPGKKTIFAVLTATMFLSVGSLYLYPQLKMAMALNIHRSLWGVIIIRVFSIGVAKLYIARGYINTIPREIDEAAKIDGCSFFRIYWNIILPLLKPLIATIGLLSFRQAWNDYLLPRVFTLGNMNHAPLVVGVIGLKSTGEATTSWNLMIAGTSISILPMIVVYLFLNRYFIEGLTVGSVKG